MGGECVDPVFDGDVRAVTLALGLTARLKREPGPGVSSRAAPPTVV